MSTTNTPAAVRVPPAALPLEQTRATPDGECCFPITKRQSLYILSVLGAMVFSLMLGLGYVYKIGAVVLAAPVPAVVSLMSVFGLCSKEGALEQHNDEESLPVIVPRRQRGPGIPYVTNEERGPVITVVVERLRGGQPQLPGPRDRRARRGVRTANIPPPNQIPEESLPGQILGPDYV